MCDLSMESGRLSWERFAKISLEVVRRFEFILHLPLLLETLGQKQNVAAYSLPAVVSVFHQLHVLGILQNTVCFGIIKANQILCLMRLHSVEIWQPSSDNTCLNLY